MHSCYVHRKYVSEGIKTISEHHKDGSSRPFNQGSNSVRGVYKIGGYHGNNTDALFYYKVE